MILDGHIHIHKGPVQQERLLAQMREAGVDGGALLSLAPATFPFLGQPLTARERLDNVMEWVRGAETLFPVFWIDPLEPDALDQVALAHKRGVKAFKVICNRFFPGNPRALEVFSAIAQVDRPIFFHSGILWDGADSSRYNHPTEFEALLAIDGLKFSLAHVSWPWCDEHIAVFGKLRQAHKARPDLALEMFVDTTPGTPVIYRQEVLTKLFTVGYQVEDHVFFGTDNNTGDYNANWAREWIERDNGIYKQLGLRPEVVAKITSGNLARFLGLQ